MSVQLKLIALLKASLPNVQVYSGDIPENVPRPAVSLVNLSFAKGRVLSGQKTDKSSVWRITLSDTVEHLQTAIESIELIDNTSNDDFQRLLVDLTQIEPKQFTERYQRAFFDLTVYPRGRI